MTHPKKRRLRRRRLKAHDRGENRHVKSAQWDRKQARLATERANQPKKKEQ